jgi:gas vesicle protein
MAEEPNRIRDEIESTRSDLARNVDLLADKTIPTRVAQRRWAGVKEKVRGVSDRVMGAPSSGSQTFRDSAGPAQTVRDTARSAAYSVQSAASQTGDKASEVAGNVTDTVRQAPQAVTRKTQGNPVAAGVIAFGVGLLAASVIPATEAEKRAGAHLKDNAGDLIEPVRQPLSESAQQLKQDLSGSLRNATDQVKETARNAAQTTAEEAKSSAQDVKEQTSQAASNAT